MRKKIGLFLSAERAAGGSFQYNQSMLESLSSLPDDRFEKVICYIDSVWIPHIRECRIPSLQIHTGFWKLFATKRVSGYLPIPWWRKHSPHFCPISSALLDQRCHLWIFPSQDTWTYLLPVPSLGTIYDLMHKYERRFPEVSAYGLFRTREKHYANLCRWANGILVDSRIGKEQVTESYALEASRIHVLPFVVPRHISSNRKSHHFSRCYSLPEKFFFYPAQFWEHKNHKILIKAMASLICEIPDMHLVFVGSKKNGYESTHELVEKLQLLDHVHFLGYVSDSDISEFYRRARALIMPTFFGPTNIPPLEAMTVGCPVAVSRIYGMPEQLGDAAVYFDPSSKMEVMQVMKALWKDDDLCRELSRRGLSRSVQWTQSHFNIRFQEIIEGILNQIGNNDGHENPSASTGNHEA